MESPSTPAKRPVPQKIDPQKFIGGANVEKLKGLIKDVESFATSVRGKAKEVEETFDNLRDITQKFGETVQFMHQVADANRQIMEQMAENLRKALEEKDGRNA